jgi:hypothetical protein
MTTWSTPCGPLSRPETTWHKAQNWRPVAPTRKAFFGIVRERERLLARLSALLSEIARPYSCDEVIPVDVRADLWQLGLACEATTPREDLIAQLWERKRSLQTILIPLWDGPGALPPSAA